MTDCPICRSPQCVDDAGYCCTCGKSVRTALAATPPRKP